MQSALSRIRTQVAVSISYNDNHYTTGHLLDTVNCHTIFFFEEEEEEEEEGYCLYILSSTDRKFVVVSWLVAV